MVFETENKNKQNKLNFELVSLYHHSGSDQDESWNWVGSENQMTTILKLSKASCASLEPAQTVSQDINVATTMTTWGDFDDLFRFAIYLSQITNNVQNTKHNVVFQMSLISNAF